MLLRSLHVKNIRSYTEAKIDFQKGTTLLSGDIGTGKTTLLLAIEFAIFGLLRGQTSGSTLLRHGQKEGSVALSLELNGKTITIKRNLKRGNAIVQDSGELIINGEQTIGTATELKAKILQIIGYPDELLTKSKSLIYRYTVYTPQEEMKHILYENQDERLDTLRRLFNIDKYKRIQENLLLYTRELRSQIKALESQTQTAAQIEQEKQKQWQELQEKQALLKQLTQEVMAERQKLEVLQQQHQKLEQQLQEYRELREKQTLNKTQIQNVQEQLQRNAEETEILRKQIDELQKQIPPLSLLLPEQLQEQIQLLQHEIQKLEGQADEHLRQETQEKTLQRTAQELGQKIQQLNNCPTCLQQVDDNHKNHILEEQSQKTLASQQKLEEIKQKQTELQNSLQTRKKQMQEVQEQYNQQALNQLKLQNLSEKKQQLNKCSAEQKALQQRLSLLQAEQEEISKKIAPYAQLDPEHQKLKQELEQKRSQTQQLEIREAKLQNEHEQLQKQHEKTLEELQKLKQLQKKQAYMQELENWAQNGFSPLIETMEKHVLTSLYQEFNSYFTNWFDQLIEDENLHVRLNETFTPIIEQNGYESSVENLSGGEKTSLALSYRLALNKVVNDFISGIQTKDLLILDEPTDGFSTEQLDKVREVLQQLNLKQIILVSHEPKMESYADHVLRVMKNEHTSQVIA